MNRKILSIILAIVFSGCIVTSAMATVCTGSTDCLHCNGLMKPSPAGKTNNSPKGCCQTKQSTPCAPSKVKSINPLMATLAVGVELTDESNHHHAGTVLAIADTPTAQRVRSKTVLPPLLEPIPIFILNATFII